MEKKLDVATLGGGCFWCLEAVFEDLRGVERVESGYAGGTPPSPTYRQVCDGNTGHAEVVQITFDPKTISFAGVSSYPCAMPRGFEHTCRSAALRAR